MRTIITALVMLLVASPAFCQDIYTPVLEQIENNSMTLRAYKEQMDARKLGNKTGLAPANPEVEFGYLWGAPSAIGARKDINVRQTFDFPTVYGQRSRLSDLRNNSAEYEYRAQRMKLLLSAKNLMIELVYYNSLAAMYERHLKDCAKIAETYRRMKELGEANQIEYNKAVLNYTNINNEVQRINLERHRILSELTRLNGGKPVVFDSTSYDSIALPADFDTWYATAETENPALKYLKSEVEVSNRQISLAKASNLPKLSVGYMGEFVKGNNFQGLTIGVSIPLWENRNKVRQAQAAAQASALVVEDAKMQYYCQLKELYAQAIGLQANIQSYNQVFEQSGNSELLYKAYSKGEISLLTYLLEMEYYFTAYDNRLKAQRDFELAVARLNAAML